MPYRYEDIDDGRFQQLCQALIVHSFPTAECLPIRQPDGGRDAVVRGATPGTEQLIFQIKLVTADVADPVTWLERILRAELPKLRKLAAQRPTRYILVTNAKASAHPRVGRADRLSEILSNASADLGIELICWWRDDLDRRMDLAPDQLKLNYPEVLVGFDAYRNLVARVDRGEQQARIDRLVRGIAASQWIDDQTVRFKQAGLDAAALADLFVDVGVRSPTGDQATSPLRESSAQRAVATFLDSSAGSTVLWGAPGQGKSTLMQFLCQVYRAVLLEDVAFFETVGEPFRPKYPRLAFRLELRDYAEWMEGIDPFSAELPKARRPRGRNQSLESFWAHSAQQSSSGIEVTQGDLEEVLDRYPTFVALDGLDEVASSIARSRVVTEIEKLNARLQQFKSPHLVVVTARPSDSELAEPSRNNFRYQILQPLTEGERIDYLRKWTHLQGIDGRERRELERIFRTRSAETYVLELATNPMQLTILLYLIHERDESLPRDRTELYSNYMSRYLDREAKKDASVSRHRQLLEPLAGYLAWHLQGEAEMSSGTGRIPLKALKKLFLEYLFDRDLDTSLVEELFTTMRDRVWVITSRVQGTYEFDVQTIREYFTAQHLIETAPPNARRGGFDKLERFRSIAARPFWLNTTRFMAGFFTSGELLAVADTLDQIREAQPFGFWARRLSRTLIQDGVFDAQPRARLHTLRKSIDQIGERILAQDLGAGQTPYSSERGGSDLVGIFQPRVMEAISESIAPELSRVLAKHLSEERAAEWWLSEFNNAPKGTRLSWLRIARDLGIGPNIDSRDLANVSVDNLNEQSLLLAAGVEPADDWGDSYLDCVLDGRNLDIGARARSVAAELQAAVRPDRLVAPRSDSDRDMRPKVSATVQLRKRGPQFQPVLEALRPSGGVFGDTARFGNVARALDAGWGRSWLARELAVSGAALWRLTLAGNRDSNGTPFGVSNDSGTLLRDLRLNAARVSWWMHVRDELETPLDEATWLTGLASCASVEVLNEVSAAAEELFETLPQHFREVVTAASKRIGELGDTRRLSERAVLEVARKAPRVALLAANTLPGQARAALARNLTAESFAWPDEPGLAVATAREAFSARWVLANQPLELGEEYVGLAFLLGPLADVGSEIRPMSVGLCELIMANAVRVPWGLIAAAEGKLAAGRSDTSAFEDAIANGWFIPLDDNL